MTAQELLAKILPLHDPAAAKVEGGHVLQLWEDGEITMTKCGSLLGMRNLHQIVGPILDDEEAAPILAAMPMKNANRHGYVYLNCNPALSIDDIERLFRQYKYAFVRPAEVN
jgi:hypothetical protein